MENILNDINRRCVQLAQDEKKKNCLILQRVVPTVIKELKKDRLFETLYRREFYGGSFYDGLKVGKSTEFDIDLLFVLPKNSRTTVKPSNQPGFVNVHVGELKTLILEEKYKGLEKLCDLTNNQISTSKTKSWVEGLITTAVAKLCPPGRSQIEIEFEGRTYETDVKIIKSGPAFNLNVKAESEDDKVVLDVDLVPCFLFSVDCWPCKSAGYRQRDPQKHGQKDTFFTVPKSPTNNNCQNPEFYWRLSFQEQERELISGCNMGRLKPALRLIKKMRDFLTHATIASYYIKTIFLWEVENRSEEFWSKPLEVVFFEMLKVYGEKLKSGSIEYYWNKQNNLISGCKTSTLSGIACKIQKILGEVERKSTEDPFVIAKYFVPPEELEEIRAQVDIGKRKTQSISQNPVSSSIVSTSSMAPNLSTCSSTEGNHEEIIEKLKFDVRFKKMIEEMVDGRVEEILVEYKLKASNTTGSDAGDNSILEELNSVSKENKFLLQKNAELEHELLTARKEINLLRKKLDELCLLNE